MRNTRCQEGRKANASIPLEIGGTEESYREANGKMRTSGHGVRHDRPNPHPERWGSVVGERIWAKRQFRKAPPTTSDPALSHIAGGARNMFVSLTGAKLARAHKPTTRAMTMSDLGMSPIHVMP